MRREVRGELKIGGNDGLTAEGNFVKLELLSGRLAQLVRALARHARGQWFESTTAHHCFISGWDALRVWAAASCRARRFFVLLGGRGQPVSGMLGEVS